MNALQKYLYREILKQMAVARGLPVPFTGRSRRQRATPYLDDWGESTATYRWRSKNLAKINNRDERRAAL